MGGVLWTVFYDTIYAFPDREFDRKLGLRSCALEFEKNPKMYLTGIASLAVASWLIGGYTAGILNAPFLASLAGVSAHFAWQLNKLDITSQKTCWKLFVSNRYLALILLSGIIIGKKWN